MEDYSTGSDSEYANSWVSWFLNAKGNEYYVQVDEDYILDRFNLTGLNAEVVQEYSRALDLITDQLADEDDMDEELRETIDASARFLYGLIHARYIITTRGLTKMLEKYRKADFGRCPRVYCYQQPFLPVGLTDTPYQKPVKLYCPRCEDIYSPKSNRHGAIDGAYFGTTFPHMLFMVYPHMVPSKRPQPQTQSQVQQQGQQQAQAVGGQGPGYLGQGPQGIGQVGTAAAASKAEMYDPKLFGFRVNESAKLRRWREAMRDRQIKRLEGIEKEEGGGVTNI